MTALQHGGWEESKAILRREIGPDHFDAWFSGMRLEDVTNSSGPDKTQYTAHATVPTHFLKRRIETKYACRLLEAVQSVDPSIYGVEIRDRGVEAGVSQQAVPAAPGDYRGPHQSLDIASPDLDEYGPLQKRFGLTTFKPRLKVEDVQRVVARQYNLTRGDMISTRRTANVVRPKQIAMYFSKTLTGRSLPEIGRRFGGRDHTTVMHAVRKMAWLVGDKSFLPPSSKKWSESHGIDEALVAEIESLKRQLLG